MSMVNPKKDHPSHTKEAIPNVNVPNFCAVRPVFMLSVGAQLLAFVLILATGDTLGQSWDELGLLSFFVQWVALASAAALCLSRSLLNRLPFVWAMVLTYFLILATSGMVAYFAQIFIEAFDYQWGASPETMDDFVSRCVMITAVIALVALRYFYIQQQWKLRIELESQARVEALQARIRPHFLFNSMNIIASLIHSNPRAAEQAVEDLSELFRATLREQGSFIAFSEEWSLCQSYLNIEALRLGNRLHLQADLSAVPQDAAIPMLTLQPLFENAIYHGIQPIPEGGTIEVHAEVRDNIIEIKIRNPIPKITPPTLPKGNRIAMINIGHRLNLLFGSQAQLKVYTQKEYYEVGVSFPYQKKGRRYPHE
jgi:two-component system, LytTR family, sensor histidine kinase AlgZ